LGLRAVSTTAYGEGKTEGIEIGIGIGKTEERDKRIVAALKLNLLTIEQITVIFEVTQQYVFLLKNTLRK
jgi:hypothetical protein